MLPDAKGLSLCNRRPIRRCWSGGDLDSLTLNAESCMACVPRGEIVAGYRHIEPNNFIGKMLRLEEAGTRI